MSARIEVDGVGGNHVFETDGALVILSIGAVHIASVPLHSAGTFHNVSTTFQVAGTIAFISFHGTGTIHIASIPPYEAGHLVEYILAHHTAQLTVVGLPDFNDVVTSLLLTEAEVIFLHSGDQVVVWFTGLGSRLVSLVVRSNRKSGGRFFRNLSGS